MWRLFCRWLARTFSGDDEAMIVRAIDHECQQRRQRGYERGYEWEG